MEATEETIPQQGEDGMQTIHNNLSLLIEQVQEHIHQVIVGQNGMIEQLLAGLLADGHILIEGVPGVAKTLTAKLLARLIDTRFSRLQFTPRPYAQRCIGHQYF